MLAQGQYSALCAFADWFPILVAGELEQARTLNYQSRETSWTDRMLLEVKKLRDPRNVVKNSNERVTGADMDWHFVRRDGRRHLHLAVQAKILHYTRPRAPHRYEELAYPDRSGRQSRQLTKFARTQLKQGFNTFPLYLFYNPASAVAWPIPCSPGITHASAYRIAHHLNVARQSSSDSKVSLQALEFETVEPLMFCLHSIFCSYDETIADPDQVAQSLAIIDAEKRENTIGGPRPPRPEAGEQVPPDIERIIGRMRDGDRAAAFKDEDEKPLMRPRVIFLSGDAR